MDKMNINELRHNQVTNRDFGCTSYGWLSAIHPTANGTRLEVTWSKCVDAHRYIKLCHLCSR